MMTSTTRALVATTLMSLAGAALAADVGVSISIGDPRFFGQIELGNAPRPQLIYPAPVVIQQAPRGVVYQPVYMRVPPGHAKDWKKHCRKYDACGRPVYFVRDDWYQNVYAPEYRRDYGHGRDRDDDDRGRGKGHGKGHGKHRDD